MEIKAFREPTRRNWFIGAAVVICLAFVGLGVHLSAPASTQAADVASVEAAESDEPIEPIAAAANLDPKKIELGRKLFADGRLSHDNRVSCGSCHDLRTGGTDRRQRSIGIHGALGEINAPTVLNSGFNFVQFWDGRADTLEAQVDGPVLSKTEMGSTWAEVIGKLEGSGEYTEAFRSVYGGAILAVQVRNSIAEFERSLSTPNSRFDRYLRHDANALTVEEQRGYMLFKSSGCASCHQGMNAGGNMYHKLGVMAPYFEDRGNITRADRGRFNVTGNPHDMYMFKVPSLRNVELTAPYFHDGTAPTLSIAVDMMAKYQLGHTLKPEETDLIVAFLKTLTGKLNGQPL